MVAERDWQEGEAQEAVSQTRFAGVEAPQAEYLESLIQIGSCLLPVARKRDQQGRARLDRVRQWRAGLAHTLARRGWVHWMPPEAAYSAEELVEDAGL